MLDWRRKVSFGSNYQEVREIGIYCNCIAYIRGSQWGGGVAFDG